MRSLRVAVAVLQLGTLERARRGRRLTGQEELQAAALEVYNNSISLVSADFTVE